MEGGAFCEVGQNGDQLVMDEVSAFVADQLGACVYRRKETHITDQG